MVINTLRICAVINNKLHDCITQQVNTINTNMQVFNLELNRSGDGDSLISSGILFHRRGAAAWNERLPKYSRRHFTGVSRCWSADRRARLGWYGASKSFRYAGASPFRALYIRRRILNLILYTTGSQWRLKRTGVICAYFLVRVTILAALFWHRWSWLIWLSWIPCSNELQ